MATVLVVVGSPVTGSRSERLADLAAAQLTAAGHHVPGLLLRDLPAVPLLAGDHRHPCLRDTAAAVAAADGVVLAAPVYKASLPGLLKCWLDILPRHALAGRSVLPLATARFAEDLPLFARGLGTVLSSMAAGRVHPVAGVLDGLTVPRTVTSALATFSADLSRRSVPSCPLAS